MKKNKTLFIILANGPREPGVGAELVTPPEECLNYEEDLERYTLTRVDSLTSSEPEIDDRVHDFEVRNFESGCQFEDNLLIFLFVFLQEVMDLKQRANQLAGRSADGSESTSNQWEFELQASIEKLNQLPYETSETNIIESTKANDALKDNNSRDVEKNDQNIRKQFDDFYQGWQSLTQSPFNSFISKSKIALKNSFSRSLTNSPMNRGLFAASKSSPEDSSDKNFEFDKDNGNEQQESRLAVNPNTQEQSKHESPSKLLQPHSNDTQFHHKHRKTLSLNSTPVRNNSAQFSSNFLNSAQKGPNSNSEQNLSIKTKELPLLSLFQKSTSEKLTIDKSCSMINLNEKQNLKALLDSSELGNIQAVSVERLANARHKLVGDSN